MIALVDYGMGNLKSVFNAFEALGEKVRVTSNPEVIQSASKVILPGVGAFGDAMGELEKRNLVSVIKETIKKNKPFLGVCLGLQLLFEKSNESEGISGLSIFPGTIKRFHFNAPLQSLKIPHMGWNIVTIKRSECPLIQGVPHNAYFYFVHSFYADTDNEEINLAATQYGGVTFSSMVWKDSVFATQFHPEKSQDVGLKILNNFVRL